MRTLTVMEHVSLDGVVQHTADETGFPYGDWTAPYRSAEGRDAVIAAQAGGFDLLLGRRTYDLWCGHWPTAPSSPLADGMNTATKYVVTHRPESLEWGPCEAVGPDLAEGVRRVKAQDGPKLLLWGSAAVASAVLDEGLADEVLLLVYPLLLGTGKRLLADRTAACRLELVSSVTLPVGVMVNRYRAAGRLRTE